MVKPPLSTPNKKILEPSLSTSASQIGLNLYIWDSRACSIVSPHTHTSLWFPSCVELYMFTLLMKRTIISFSTHKQPHAQEILAPLASDIHSTEAPHKTKTKQMLTRENQRLFLPYRTQRTFNSICTNYVILKSGSQHPLSCRV